MYNKVCEFNKNYKIHRITDKEFSKYGRVLNLKAQSLIEKAKVQPFPESGVSYIPSIEELEKDNIFKTLQNDYFGQLPIQIGLCCGYSNQLNALEWHTASEINIAVKPIILMLGLRQDIADGKYNSANVEMFYLDVGEAVEIYATTLHYTPSAVSEEGFSSIVVLPVGTNTPLTAENSDKTLRAKNKWLIAHNENERLISGGAASGIYGENYRINLIAVE